MKREDNIGIWMATGIVGAILLGIALIPLREVTSASNLAFAFLVWMLFIAELGGRAAAVATAVVSAISLNFFLTQPYLSLTIEDRDDIIAFVAMLIVGLLAAYFGKRRKRWQDEAEQSGHDLDVLETTAKQIARGAPLAEVLAGLRSAFRLKGIALYDASGKRLASAPSNFNFEIPAAKLELNELFSAGETELRMGSRGFLLPPEGRLEIASADGAVAVDLWGGDPEGYSIGERQALVVAALLVARSVYRK